MARLFGIGLAMAYLVAVLSATLVVIIEARSSSSDTLYVQGEGRGEFGTTAPDCRHVYNVGDNRAWADCMGVPYK